MNENYLLFETGISGWISFAGSIIGAIVNSFVTEYEKATKKYISFMNFVD